MSVAEGTAWASSRKIDWRLLPLQETCWYWLVGTTGHDHGAGDHRRTTASRPQALVRAGAQAARVHATTVQF